MAGSARSVFTRLLPWAALALMTVMFFVQVKARRAAERDAEAARAAAPVVIDTIGHSDRLGGTIAGEAEAQTHRAQLTALTRQLEVAQEDLAAARAAHAALQAKAERTEALRVTQTARAKALDAQLAADAAAAEERVAALQAELADAQAELARRKSPVARWLALAEGGAPDALAVIRAETAKATADDVAELAARWKTKPPAGGALEVAYVLEHVPVSVGSALLAADLYLGCEQASHAAKVVSRLGAHIVHATAVVRVLGQGRNEKREDVLALASAATDRGWDAEGRARVAAALDGLLQSDDAWTIEIGIRAFAQLGLEGHEGKLLRFLTHEVPDVRIAAVYALLATSDRKSAVRTLHPTVLALLDEGAFDVRMAGLFLAQELAGEKRSLAFGSSDQAIAKEIARLKQKLATLAKEPAD